MPANTSPFESERAYPVHYTRGDDLDVTIPPPSLRQLAESLRLDPKPDAPAETPKARIVRLHRQAQILFGKEFAYLTEKLTLLECGDLVQVLYLTAGGIDAENYHKFQQLRRRQRTSLEMVREIEAMTIALAAQLKVTPNQAAETALADASALLKRLGEQGHREAEFEAALHDKKLD